MMLKTKFFLLTIILFLSYGSFAQKEANTWYFGNNAGIDFNTVPPQAITDSKMNTWEGCASISDSLGRLLMYTDGMTVWNADHDIMQNGEGLFGDNSSTESAIIIPQPGNQDIHYLFTVDDTAGDSGLCYSIVDMRLDNGKGAITTAKNIEILNPVPEKVTAVYHANGKDVWIISHKWGNNEFYAWLLTEDGLSNTPVVSAVGTPHIVPGEDPTLLINKIGYMKCSPNGKKVALALLNSSIVELFDFDNNSGTLSNPITFPFVSGINYGVEFSPDCSKLYATEYQSLYQFNLNAGTDEEIIDSRVTIYTFETLAGAIQLATDGKIYTSINFSEHLGIINQPDSIAQKCDFNPEGIFLNGGISQMGLPDFMQSYFLPPSFRISGNCTGNIISMVINNSAVFDSVNWDFDDPQSGLLNFSTAENPTHIFETSGFYNINLTLWDNGQPKTINEYIEISLPELDLGNDTILCPDAELNLDAFSDNCTYLWQDLSDNSEFIVESPGTYHVSIYNNITNCGNTDTININYSTLPEINIGTDTAFCKNTVYKLDAFHEKYTYVWNTNETDSSISVQEPGQYFVQITDSLFCVNSDTINLLHYPLPEFSLGADTSICANSQYLLTTTISPVEFLWNNNSVESSFLISSFGGYSLIVTDSVTCQFSDTILITEATIFEPYLPADTTLCYPDELAFEFIKEGVSFLWDDGISGEVASFSEPGVYTMLSANKCGESLTSTQLSYKFCGEIYIPNIITPNDDAVNDEFYIQGISETQWEIIIYSRWGDVVHESSSYQNNWNADCCTGGTYYYILTSKQFDQSFSGWLQVIK